MSCGAWPVLAPLHESSSCGRKKRRSAPSSRNCSAVGGRAAANRRRHVVDGPTARRQAPRRQRGDEGVAPCRPRNGRPCLSACVNTGQTAGRPRPRARDSAAGRAVAGRARRLHFAAPSDRSCCRASARTARPMGARPARRDVGLAVEHGVLPRDPRRHAGPFEGIWIRCRRACVPVWPGSGARRHWNQLPARPGDGCDDDRRICGARSADLVQLRQHQRLELSERRRWTCVDDHDGGSGDRKPRARIRGCGGELRRGSAMVPAIVDWCRVRPAVASAIGHAAGNPDVSWRGVFDTLKPRGKILAYRRAGVVQR
jgi:hypothetical protein